MRELLTVARSPKGAPIGAKVWPRGSVTAAPLLRVPKLLLFEQLEVGSLPEWLAAVEKLAAQPDRFPIRGDLLERAAAAAGV